MPAELGQMSEEFGLDLEKLVAEFDPQAIIDREQAAGQPFGPFHRAELLKRAPESARRMLRKAAERPELVAVRQGFAAAEMQEFPPANLRAAINTTTTETNLWDPALWAPIPALDMKAGKKYSVEFGGVCGTTATPTIAMRARCGTNNSAPPTGTDLGIGPTMTLGSFTAQPFYGWFSMGVRNIAVAASGASVTGNGYAIFPGAAAATTVGTCVMGGAVPTTVDHTIAQGLGVSITWGTSNASNTLTPQWVSFFSTN